MRAGVNKRSVKRTNALFLGLILLENAQTKADARDAVRWIRRAAEEGGIPGAWAMMSRIYTTGLGLYVNKKKAAECLKRAKALGWRGRTSARRECDQ